MRRASASRARELTVACLIGALCVGAAEAPGHLGRAKVFLAAADYRRALEACERRVEEAPSAQSYTFLTYCYQTLDGYIEHLAKQDKWVAVEQLYLSLSYAGPRELTDPPEVLARIAKELMQDSARRHSDIAAAMATRLDKETVERLWKQQTDWRKAHPDDWFHGVPAEWNW